MNKQEFTDMISRFEPDSDMKYRIARKVLNRKELNKIPQRIKKKTLIVSICAAALAVIISVPVMAEHIPAVKSAIEFIMNSFSKEPIEHNDAIAEYVDNVDVSAEDSENDITFNVQDIYYDGKDIVIYYCFETANPDFVDYIGVSSEDFELYADGKKIVWSDDDFYESVRIISSARASENLFMGMIQFKADVLPDYDNFNMEIKINSLLGNKNIMVFNYDAENPAYNWQASDMISANISCKFDVQKKNDLVKTYTIGEEKAGFVLNSVTVTPLKTLIDLSNENNEDIAWTLTDNNGNELEHMGYNEFNSPLKDTKYLTLSLKDMYKDGFPEICSFTFSIDEGYRSKNIDLKFVRREPEYIPPQSEADQWIKENRKKITAAECDVNPAGNYIHAENKKLSVTVSDYTLIKNVNDLDLSGDIFSPYENYSRIIDENGNISEKAMVVFDYTIRNNTGEEVFFGAGNEKLFSSDDMSVPLNSGDVAYISPKDNGGKKSWILNIAPYEERTVKIGFMITNENADKELIFSIGDDGDLNYLAFAN